LDFSVENQTNKNNNTKKGYTICQQMLALRKSVNCAGKWTASDVSKPQKGQKIKIKEKYFNTLFDFMAVQLNFYLCSTKLQLFAMQLVTSFFLYINCTPHCRVADAKTQYIPLIIMPKRYACSTSMRSICVQQ